MMVNLTKSEFLLIGDLLSTRFGALDKTYKEVKERIESKGEEMSEPMFYAFKNQFDVINSTREKFWYSKLPK